MNIEEIAKEHAGKNFDNTEEVKEFTGEYLLLNKVTEIPALVHPILHKVGLACLAGSSDTGKSSILRQLAIEIVTGKNSFLGFPINSTHKSAIYVSSEDDESATSFLLGKQAAEFLPEVLKELRFIFDTYNLIATLEKKLTVKPADIVIIDCFADAYSKDLKDTQQIRTYLHDYQQLSVRHKCLVLFLHHTGKRTENFEPSKNNLLSGQGFESKMRLVIELRADLMNPHERHLCLVKGNYLPSTMKKESYVLLFDEKTFTFSNTGKRMPFELLAKQADSDNGKAKYEQAKELKEQGLTYEQIAPKIGFASKSSVAKLFKKHDADVSNGNEGNETETKP